MTQIHIVGTAHVSEKSIQEVLDTIDRVSPEVIAIELDRGRYAALKQQMREEDAAKAAAAAEASGELSAAGDENADENTVSTSGYVTSGENTYIQSGQVSDVPPVQIRSIGSVPVVSEAEEKVSAENSKKGP